jgi:hypothetical protein
VTWPIGMGRGDVVAIFFGCNVPDSCVEVEEGSNLCLKFKGFLLYTDRQRLGVTAKLYGARPY